MNINITLTHIIYREFLYSVLEFSFDIRYNCRFLKFIDWLFYQYFENKFCFFPGKYNIVKYYRDYGK
jgi:hypothetical protein